MGHRLAIGSPIADSSARAVHSCLKSAILRLETDVRRNSWDVTMAKRDSFLLRLSPEVLDSIRRWADDELRSANAQIEMILTRALRDAGRLPKATLEQQDKNCPEPPKDSESSPPTA